MCPRKPHFVSSLLLLPLSLTRSKPAAGLACWLHLGFRLPGYRRKIVVVVKVACGISRPGRTEYLVPRPPSISLLLLLAVARFGYVCHHGYTGEQAPQLGSALAARKTGGSRAPPVNSRSAGFLTPREETMNENSWIVPLCPGGRQRLLLFGVARPLVVVPLPKRKHNALVLSSPPNHHDGTAAAARNQQGPIDRTTGPALFLGNPVTRLPMFWPSIASERYVV